MSVLRIAPSDTDSESSWVSIYNLTVESENSTLWTALLSSFLGYPLLSPTMKTKHVYLTMPSNSSMNYFPNNTLTHYTTKLPKIMDLDGTWQIGLAEIHYPHSWYNVKNKEAWLIFRYQYLVEIYSVSAEKIISDAFSYSENV